METLEFHGCTYKVGIHNKIFRRIGDEWLLSSMSVEEFKAHLAVPDVSQVMREMLDWGITKNDLARELGVKLFMIDRYLRGVLPEYCGPIVVKMRAICEKYYFQPTISLV